MADYDLDLQYHPGRVNVVPDHLSRKPVVMRLTRQRELLVEFWRMNMEIILPGAGRQLMSLQLQSTLVDRIKATQFEDARYKKFKKQVESGEGTNLQIHEDGSLRFRGRLCVPKGDVRRELLEEAHSSVLSIHPGGTKMYRDLREHYWWPGMKMEIARFVSKCLTCQQVKAEHQRTAGLLQSLLIPE